MTNPKINKYQNWNIFYSPKISHSLKIQKRSPLNSWTLHAFCDSVLSYESNRWKFEHVLGNSMGNEIWSIYCDQTLYESNIKSLISNTIDNFDGAVLDYHCAKKEMLCIDNISVHVFCVFLYSRSFPKHFEKP